MKWIEEAFLLFSYSFGNDFQEQRGFLFPVYEHFPFDDLSDKRQLNDFGRRLAELMELDPDTIRIGTFGGDGVRKMIGDMPVPTSETIAYHDVIESGGREICTVYLSRQKLNNPIAATYLVAKRLSIYRLAKAGYNFALPLKELLPDLAVIFFGFGVFIDNIRFVKNAWSSSKIGQLPVGMIAAANSLYALMFHCDPKRAGLFFQSNSRQLFLRGYNYLDKKGCFLLTEENRNDKQKQQEFFEQVRQKNDHYIRKEEEALIRLKYDPGNGTLINNLNYYRLCQGRYEEAIVGFTEAIRIMPDWAFPYNNRGYCRLMTGKLEEGKADIERSLEMKADNAFAWRNLGIYWLKKSDGLRAIENFRKAFNINPQTELIHYYMGCAYQLNGARGKAMNEFNHSQEIREMPFPEYPEI